MNWKEEVQNYGEHNTVWSVKIIQQYIKKFKKGKVCAVLRKLHSNMKDDNPFKTIAAHDSLSSQINIYPNFIFQNLFRNSGTFSTFKPCNKVE